LPELAPFEPFPVDVALGCAAEVPDVGEGSLGLPAVAPAPALALPFGVWLPFCVPPSLVVAEFDLTGDESPVADDRGSTTEAAAPAAELAPAEPDVAPLGTATGELSPGGAPPLPPPVAVPDDVDWFGCALLVAGTAPAAPATPVPSG
jgi:hypothetical protein